MALKTIVYTCSTHRCSGTHKHRIKEDVVPLRRMRLPCRVCKLKVFFYPAKRPLTGNYR